MNIEPISRSCITYSTVISLDCARNNIALNYDLTHAPESCFLCENLLQQLHSRLKRDLKVVDQLVNYCQLLCHRVHTHFDASS